MLARFCKVTGSQEWIATGSVHRELGNDSVSRTIGGQIIQRFVLPVWMLQALNDAVDPGASFQILGLNLTKLLHRLLAQPGEILH